MLPARVLRRHLSSTELRQVGNGKAHWRLSCTKETEKERASLAERDLLKGFGLLGLWAWKPRGTGLSCCLQECPSFLGPVGMTGVACGCYLFSEWQVCTRRAWFILPNVPELRSFVVGFISCCLRLHVDTCHLWRQYRTHLHGLVCERKEVM